MPMHNWTKVRDDIFHAFHHRWVSAVCDDLNTGRLPADYYALPEQPLEETYQAAHDVMPARWRNVLDGNA